ncbi:MAG: YggS family pyridoxal phosphate-dependent enzyme [Bacteroidota bacterium]
MRFNEQMNAGITERLVKIRKTLPEGVALVAVSKTKSETEILEAYRTGQRIFGENKIQEMSKKQQTLPKDIEWHMIGHVQRNKVKYMAPYVALIHGVDSLKLLREIDKQAKKNERTIPCLFQVHIATESTKFGFNEEELTDLVQSQTLEELQNVQILGLMGMATFTENTAQIRKEFQLLKSIFDRLQPQLSQMRILSMGMSGDYPVALEEGSNMVRIGSSIFGARNYSQ